MQLNRDSSFRFASFGMTKRFEELGVRWGGEAAPSHPSTLKDNTVIPSEARNPLVSNNTAKGHSGRSGESNQSSRKNHPENSESDHNALNQPVNYGISKTTKMIKRLIPVFIGLMLAVGACGQNYKELIKQANASYTSKDYKKSNELYLEAFKLETNNPFDLYNGACSAALSGDTRQAFIMLHLSVQNGWTDLKHLKTDSDLDNLHRDKDWDGLINRVQKVIDSIESGYDKPLKAELEEIYKYDQGIRIKYAAAANKSGYGDPKTDSLKRIMVYQDSLNCMKVSEILDTKGWQGKEKVGEMGNLALFLVIQHADLKTQEKYLPMMREALKKGNLSEISFAKFEDRVALRQGKRQLYGTQVLRDAELDKWFVGPLEDPENVDKRRAGLGLPPIAEFARQFGIVWDLEEYKKQLPQIELLNQKVNRK